MAGAAGVPPPVLNPGDIGINELLAGAMNAETRGVLAATAAVMLVCLFAVWLVGRSAATPKAAHAEFVSTMDFVNALEDARKEQEALILRLLRTGRWDDATKQRWKEEFEDCQVSLELARAQTVGHFGQFYKHERQLPQHLHAKVRQRIATERIAAVRAQREEGADAAGEDEGAAAAAETKKDK